MQLVQNNNFQDTSWYQEYTKFENDVVYAENKMIAELSNLVERVIGKKWISFFVFEKKNLQDSEGKDAFEIYEEDGKIHICGKNGISMASGFNYYLKRYAFVNYNPLFVSNVDMPEELPHVEGRIFKKTPYDVRFQLNYCTYGYTMAFWGWKEYEALLDWYAMNGVNLMLDIVGQEEVQRRMLREYDYTDEEIGQYLPGPAYFPWFFMQNMSGFGGPLPEEWFGQRVEIGRRMHDRMQTYGIRPALMGYAGMIPNNFAEKHPDASVVKQGKWCGFDVPDMLMVDGAEGKDYFDEMAEVFYTKQKEVFGQVTHYYSIDPFHEGGKMGTMSPADVYRKVQKKMLESDPEAIWLLQQWGGQITDEKISNLIKPEQALILDLQADRKYYHEIMERHQVPWIWCMLHNFGGRMGVDGDIVTISEEIPKKYHSSQYMTGIGATPEAYNNSPIMYDLLCDMTWTDQPIDYEEYVKQYIQSRYGSADEKIQEAWDILLHTAYWKKLICTQGAGECVINARPSENFKSASTWGHTSFEYDQMEFERALPVFLEAYEKYKTKATYRYDLIDVAKQVLSNSANNCYKKMMAAYREKDKETFRKISERFLEMIKLEDDILGCCPEFTVGKWIDRARNVLPEADKSVKDLMEFNARAILTTWGDYENSEDCLLDYSNRQWAGLTKDYYLKRWENFVRRYQESLEKDTPPVEEKYFDMEWAWANRKTSEEECYKKVSSGKDLKVLVQKVWDSCSQYAIEQEFKSEKQKNRRNLALGLKVSGNVKAAEGYPYSNLTDGKIDSIWKAAESSPSIILEIEFDAEKSIEEIAFSLPQIAGGYPFDYRIDVFSGGVWKEIPAEKRKMLMGTVSVKCTCTISKVRLVLKKKDLTQEIQAELAEIYIYG